MKLRVDVGMTLEIPDDFDARLEQGDEDAFKELAMTLGWCLNFRRVWVTQMTIHAAGPHNTIQPNDNGVYKWEA